jgi:succinate dehydrogenase / fumarate reductase, iron-sulfur subunit
VLDLHYAELEMHSRDTNDRREHLRSQVGLGICNITKYCTVLCPEHIHITDNAIILLKERVVDARCEPTAWVGRKIRRRDSAGREQGARRRRTNTRSR